MAKLGCIFNLIHSSTLGLVMRSTNRQLLPATRDEYVYSTMVDGSYHFPEGLEDRFIEVEFGFVESTTKNLRLKARKIADYLYTTQRQVLSFDDEPDKYYMAKVSNQLDLEPQIRAGRFTVTFRCLPFAYANANAYDNDPALLYDNGVQYDSEEMYDNPTGFEWGYSRHRSGLYNYSNHKAPMKLKIEGTVTNPKIVNESTLEEISLPSISSGTLEFDSEKEIVTINGVNALKDMSGVFLMLASGDNGLVFQGSSPNATVTYQWKHKFL
jgi:predicted phage tail component-like protein